MELPTPITILSDLHWGHPLGLLRRADQIGPLIEGSATVIFNGDTVEARVEHLREQAAERLGQMEEFCRAHGARAIFLTGNHDPRVSELHHLELCGGEVFVTHGDALFPTLTPWSRFAPDIRRWVREETEKALARGTSDLETRLEITRRVSERAPHLCAGSARDAGEALRHVVTEFLHPFRPLAVLRCWAELPSRAVGLAEEFRLKSRVIVVGHTHYPGCWRRRGRWVINTGGFAPLRAWARMVRIAGGEVLLYRVAHRAGSYGPGDLCSRIPLGGAR